MAELQVQRFKKTSGYKIKSLPMIIPLISKKIKSIFYSFVFNNTTVIFFRIYVNIQIYKFLITQLRRIIMHKIKSSNVKKNITVIGTGGTIAGLGHEGTTSGYQSAQVEIKDLINEIEGIKSIANVKSKDLFSVDSCDITIDNLKELVQYINKESQKDSVDGFVITHGTDTMEESAYFLNLTLKTNKPVVLTGSMRPGSALSADGPLNLCQAVALAANEQAVNKGVLVTLCDGIYGARDVSKINTFRTDAFSQRDLGCLGYMQDEKVYFYNSSLKKHTTESIFEITKDSKIPKVEIIYFYSDADSKLLEFAASHSDGLVVAGAGCGGTSNEWEEKIQKLVSGGYPVVRTSRIGNGLVSFEKDKIPEKGICSNNLNAQKSRILLSLALTQTNDFYEIQNIFNTY